MENLRSRIDIKLVNNKKDYLKCTSKPIYMSHKIFGSNLFAIRNLQLSKLALKLNKPAYIGMCILELGKILTYEFHYDYIKNEYGNNTKFLFTDTDSLMYEIKTEDAYEDFSSHKEMFDFSNYSTKSKYCDDSNKLVILKLKDEIGGFAIKEFVGLKPKMYVHFIDDSSGHKKAKGLNRNVVKTVSQNEYKNVLVSERYLRHSMNRIRSGDHKIVTYKVNKISLSYFDNKIYIQNSGYFGLALGARVNYRKQLF